MLDYAFLLPVGLLIATISMSAGVAGSNFWIPVYLLWLGLEPRVAFWTSLLTMLFGFGSGVVRNWRAGTIDGGLVRRHIGWILPAAACGAWLAPRVPVEPLLIGYAIFVTAYGVWLAAMAWRPEEGAVPSPAPVSGVDSPERRGDEEPVRGRALLAGTLQGLIATGAGSLLMPALLRLKARRPADAVGSTVLLVFLASLVSAAFRIDDVLWRALVNHRELIASMMLFAVPGAMIGGQLGPRLAQQLPAIWLRRYVALVLVIIGVLVARRVLF